MPFSTSSSAARDTKVAAKDSKDTPPRALPWPLSDDAEDSRFATPASFKATTLPSGKPNGSENAFSQVIGEIAELGEIDPAAQQQLLKQLQAAKPSHYPLVVQQFKSAYAYSRELRARSRPEELLPLETYPAVANEDSEPRLLPSTITQ